MKKNVLNLIFILFSFLHAQEALNRAQELYDVSDFKAALSIYDSILEKHPQQANILYNQALCYFKMDELGAANYHLHLALKLDYGNSNYHKLQQEIRKQLYDHFENEDQFYAYSLLKRFLYLGNTGLWAVLSIIFLLASIICFVLFKLKNFRSLKAISNLNILGFIFMISLHLALIQQQKHKSFLIVKENNVLLINEPTAQAEKVAVLHEGSKLKYIDSKSNYYEIALPNGQKAYVEQDRVYPIWFSH